MIFAWFEDKKAIVDWYKSDFHQRAMKAAFPNRTSGREPLPDVRSGKRRSYPRARQLEAFRRTADCSDAGLMQQIGIELYTPLPDGVVVGGRFAPAAVKVPGLREIDTALGPAR